MIFRSLMLLAIADAPRCVEHQFVFSVLVVTCGEFVHVAVDDFRLVSLIGPSDICQTLYLVNLCQSEKLTSSINSLGRRLFTVY